MRVVVIVLAVAALAVLGFVYSHDPANGYGLPECRLKSATGYHCPGCGGTRSAHALLHGRLDEAFYYNPLFIVALVTGALACAWIMIRKRYAIGKPGMTTRQGVVLAVTIIMAIILFGVIRNFAWYPLLRAPIHEKHDNRKTG